MGAKTLLDCEWCGRRFRRPSLKGPPPKFCRAAHRQAAFAARTAVRVPAELRVAVAAQAKRRHISYNQAVVKALRGWLNPSVYCDF